MAYGRRRRRGKWVRFRSLLKKVDKTKKISIMLSDYHSLYIYETI